VARKRNPARLVIALSVAAVLAVFLLYTSIAGGGTPSYSPSELAGKTGRVAVSGRVVGPVTGDPHDGGLRFRLRDVKGSSKTTVPVVYEGSVPDLFGLGRDIHVEGHLTRGTFVAVPGTLVTKCPSKYTPAKKKV
jgi:cytochrome c-type biogenesis protein CcmE